MEKKVINITNENYTQYVPLVPIAFSYAEGGAMGCPGQIVIIDNNSRIYSLDIYDFEEDAIKIIIPVLFECKFGMFGKDIPALEWHNFYLGMDNHLMVKDSIFDEFYPKAGEYDGEPGILYQKWIDLVLEIINR